MTSKHPRSRLSLLLFGEAERGAMCTPVRCNSLEELCALFGHPPEESQGINCAVQALLYQRELFFFRVHEEGFSHQDYLAGLECLKKGEPVRSPAAICMPGVGGGEILKASESICEALGALLLLSEQDLYDYLTESPPEK